MGIPITEENVLHTHTNKGTSTGILNVIKFELLSVITLKETICLRIWAKALPKNGKKRPFCLTCITQKCLSFSSLMSFLYFIIKGKILHFELSFLISECTEFFSHLGHIFHFSAPPPPFTCNQIIKYGCITLFLEST